MTAGNTSLPGRGFAQSADATSLSVRSHTHWSLGRFESYRGRNRIVA